MSVTRERVDEIRALYKNVAEDSNAPNVDCHHRIRDLLSYIDTPPATDGVEVVGYLYEWPSPLDPTKTNSLLTYKLCNPDTEIGFAPPADCQPFPLVRASALAAMERRVKELEAELAELKRVAGAKDDRIAELDSLLAFAPRSIQDLVKYRKFFNALTEIASDSGLDADTESIVAAGVDAGLLAWCVYDDTNEAIRDYCSEMPDIENGVEFWFVIGENKELDALSSAIGKEGENEGN